MNKKLLLVIITASILLGGCGGKVTPTNIVQKNEQSSSVTTDTNKVAAKSSGTTTASAATITTSDSIDYNQYIGKAWVKKNGSYNTSFCISNIANGKITGYFDSSYWGAVPTTYDFEKNLTGTTNKNTAECKLNDSLGNKGNIRLVFKQNNEIEATIKLTATSQNVDKRPQEGTFDFIPYNLSSIKGFSLIKDQSFMVNLNSWGNVRFVSEKLTAGHHIPTVFYLTDKEGNILFDFDSNLPYNVDVKAVSFVYLSKNGLKDIIIIASYNGVNGASELATVYLQKANGYFTNDPKLDQKINNSGNNKSVKDVKNYLSQNPNSF